MAGSRCASASWRTADAFRENAGIVLASSNRERVQSSQERRDSDCKNCLRSKRTVFIGEILSFITGSFHNILLYFMNDAYLTKGSKHMAETMFHFMDERISPQHVADGRQVVKVTPGGTNIMASIAGGKITRYEAEDSAGNYRSLFSVSQSIPQGGHIVDIGVACWVCADDPDFGVLCYEIECPPVPPPDVVLSE